MTLFLFLLFICLCVLGRVFLQYRLTGNHGIRPAGKHSPPLQIAASLLLVLSALLTLFYTLGQTLGYLQASFEPGNFQLLAGYLLYIVGLVLVLVAQYQMGSAWRIGVDPTEPTDLITRGLFQYIRNPIYTGLFIGGIGLLLISPSVILLIGLLLGYVAVELFVRKVEEPYLRQQFGTDYQSWCRTTPRYFPHFFLR
ncbi:MAG: methyltransferase family protein [Thiolinea sp.]